MYLGQLSKLREAFAACKVSVTLDSRDQEALLDREGDTDVPNDSVLVQEVQLHQQVRLPPHPQMKPSYGNSRCFCGLWTTTKVRRRIYGVYVY
jgi:hypothetical protein